MIKEKIMKYNFNFYNPTKIYFGKGSISNLSEELTNYGPNVLLAFGGGSIKKNGLYDEVVKILIAAGKKVIPFGGIMPNPTYAKLLEGVNLVKEKNIDLILAVGGGSVIDLAKGVSASSYTDNAWEKYWLKGEAVTTKIVPVGTILTMVGTGSEMNGGSVITNEEQKLKKGHVFEPSVYPKFSILDPTYTYSVPQYQMLSGIFDIMSHLMEQYFSGTDENVSDYIIEGLLKSVISSTKKAIINPQDYEARSNLMWASTLALNTLVGMSKTQDWEVHSIEHQLGAYTDCAHGMGLAAISIPYYKHIYRYGLAKFARFAREVWYIDETNKTEEELALAGIEALSNFIKDSHMVTKLRDLGATKEMLPLIANSCDIETSGYKILTKEEILSILEECY